MDDRRPQPASKIKMIPNFDFENLVSEKTTKSVEESLGVGRRSFLKPAKQVDSNKSTYTADKVSTKSKDW